MHAVFGGRFLSAIALVTISCLASTTEAKAQMKAMGRSLGGYGAQTVSASYANSGGTVWIPYSGNFGGFVPYSPAGLPATARSFRSMTSTLSIGGFSTPARSRPTIATSMSGGSSRKSIMPMNSGMGLSFNRGMGMSSTRMTSPRRLNSPFATPPSLSGGSGMSMP